LDYNVYFSEYFSVCELLNVSAFGTWSAALNTTPMLY